MKMSPSQAKEILEAHNYCLTHLEPLLPDNTVNNPLQNYNSHAYYCPKCRRLDEERDRAQVEEALEIFRNIEKNKVAAEAPRG